MPKVGEALAAGISRAANAMLLALALAHIRDAGHDVACDRNKVDDCGTLTCHAH